MADKRTYYSMGVDRTGAFTFIVKLESDEKTTAELEKPCG